MDNVFLQLAVILSLASVIGYIVLKMKLPLVVGYLLAGVVLSAMAVFDTSHSFVLSALPEIGIAFVLFLIGMELDLREIRSLGKPILLATVVQVAISSFAGFFISRLIGFPETESIFLGIGLALSSTVVIIKMLLEKRDLASLYGKLSVGILLIEDLVAIGAMMFISISGASTGIAPSGAFPLAMLAAKALALILIAFILSRFVLERVFDAVARSVELLFFTAITWCFVFTSLAVLAGFSVVIGAFIAGVALAASPYHIQIQSRVKPVRDFFLTLFFVYLGSQVRITDIVSSWPAILAFAGFALLIKPVIYMTMLGFFGFRKHTVFQAGLNMSQVSEFSLIILLLGLKYGVTSQLSLSVMAAAAVLSIIISSSLIQYSDSIYKFAKTIFPFLARRSKKHPLENFNENALRDHVVLIGADKVGGVVLSFLRKENIPMIVLDYNPHIVHQLRAEGVPVIYGDLSDPDVLDGLRLETARLIISTAAGIIDNETLLEECKRRGSKASVVVRSADSEHEKILKDLGADYVIMPERVSGDFLVSQLKNHWPNVKFKSLG